MVPLRLITVVISGVSKRYFYVAQLWAANKFPTMEIQTSLRLKD